MSIKLKGQTPGIQILGEREVGKFRPRAWDLRREQRDMQEEEERHALRRLAMGQATLTSYRETIERKMYRGEAVSLHDWPALGPLTPEERTRVLDDVRNVYRLPARVKCSCPLRRDGIHYVDCRVGK